MKNRVSIIACFGFQHNRLDGQNVKSRILAQTLELEQEITKIDTSGRKNICILPFRMIKAVILSKNIIILPAQNGIKVIMPLLALLNFIFRRNIHYVVIGGWLPEMVNSHKWLCFFLKRYNHIYVESKVMKEKLGLKNVEVMPNCKQLNILPSTVFKQPINGVYTFCTFSRVMKEKGIEDAAKAIDLINKRNNNVRLTLDIYGTVEKGQKEWFDKLLQKYEDSIHYKGVVPFSESSIILNSYYGLLFSTYYEGEGFAGTIIDAYAAGLPVIASDWKYNCEFVKHKVNGLIHNVNNIEDLVECIIWSIEHKKEWAEFGLRNNEEARKYIPENVFKIVSNNF